VRFLIKVYCIVTTGAKVKLTLFFPLLHTGIKKALACLSVQYKYRNHNKPFSLGYNKVVGFFPN